jgi:hypothetical protein
MKKLKEVIIDNIVFIYHLIALLAQCLIKRVASKIPLGYLVVGFFLSLFLLITVLIMVIIMPYWTVENIDFYIPTSLALLVIIIMFLVINKPRKIGA